MSCFSDECYKINEYSIDIVMPGNLGIEYCEIDLFMFYPLSGIINQAIIIPNAIKSRTYFNLNRI